MRRTPELTTSVTDIHILDRMPPNVAEYGEERYRASTALHSPETLCVIASTACCRLLESSLLHLYVKFASFSLAAIRGLDRRHQERGWSSNTKRVRRIFSVFLDRLNTPPLQ